MLVICSEKIDYDAETKEIKNKYFTASDYDLSLFISRSYFVNDGAQVYLVLQLICYILKRLSDTEKVYIMKI